MRDAPIVNIRYITDYPKCNFSCTYCIAGHGEVTAGRERHWDPDRYLDILGNIAKLPFKVNVRLGVAGEFFLDKTLVKGAADLSNQDNVASVNLITNLSFQYRQYKEILRSYDQAKIAMVASYHPSEIKDKPAWVDTAESMSKDYDFSVVMVAFPPTMAELQEAYHEMRSRNIEVFIQPFIGVWEGKSYPESYTEEERAEIKQLMYSRHDYEFLLNLKKPGLCNAGYLSFFVSPLGLVYPCGMGHYKTALGDLSKTSDIQLHSEALPCRFNKCQCDTENINTVKFSQHYEFDDLNQHKYHYRFEDDVLSDQSLDEWSINY